MSDQPIKRKPGRPKAEGTPETMTAILRTAAGLFMEQGFQQVSLEGVAKACGVTKASVYYYFNNKAELFTEAVLFVLSIAHAQTKAILNGSGSLRERLTLVAEKHMGNAHIDFETMMREASASLSDEQVGRIRAGENGLHLLLADAFEHAIADGTINDGNPALFAHAYTAMLNVRNRKEVVRDEHTLRQSAEDIMRLLWDGLSPRQ
ncbi:TetR/AcrR family transcriptional regulator [Paenibacillus sp. NPDC058071]|uniref:TetR/AcrR family transcriptional regulator n=1 Tax=Paenibacillus sp. NPDC058071 TaxID=3346326 RepID=UPI0036DC1A28